MSTKVSLFIIIILLTLICSESKAACTESGNMATCSGVFDPAEFPITYTADGDGIEQILLDSTVNATVVDSQGFVLQNNDELLTFDLSIIQEEGVLIDKAGSQRDPIYLLNRGFGDNLISISGTVRTNPADTGKQRGVRLWSRGETSPDSNTIEVTSSGVIDTSQTSVWIFNLGLGPSTAILNGVLKSGGIGESNGFRGAHLSNNNASSTAPVTIQVGTTGEVFSNFQALYVGHAGTGLTTLDISGPVSSGGFPARGDFDGGYTNLHAAAVITEVESGGTQININPTGSITSLNDQAIRDEDIRAHATVEASSQITNDGLLLGYVQLGGGDDGLTNNSSNSFNFRDFRDDDFDGQRDTKNVAVNDFGAGVDSFSNTATGTLRLLTVQDMSGFTAATDDDATPGLFNASGVTEYFPAGSAALPNTTAGIEQGHFVGLETFSHAGAITMADAETGGIEAVAGDTLVITGSDVAGTDGGGDFISDGGFLHLDVQLDDGATDTTDVLVVDNVTTGSGPTTISVTNANGLGALTGNGATDGILVVEVLGTSSADAFVLDGGTIQIGTYGYFLTQADGQNWYLQSVALPILTANDVGPTYNPLPLMSGTTDAADGQVVTVTDDGGAEVCTATVSSGEWSCTPGTDIAAGTFTYTASVTDTFGNTVTAGFQVIVKEPIEPLVTITEDANDDGIIDYTELSGDIDVTITLPANAEAGDTLIINQNGNSESRVLTADDISAGQVALAYPAPANGETISVTALTQLDDGSQSPSSSDSAVIDAVTPVITGDDVADTYDTQPGLTGSTNLPDGTQVTVTDSSGSTICSASVSGGQWSCTPTTELPLGNNSLTVSAQDSLGNTVSDTFTVSIIDGGALETSVDGHGGGSSSVWLLALLGLFGLLKARPRLGVMAGVMGLMMLPMTLHASDNHQSNTEYEHDRWFFGVGYGASWVDPEGESFGWRTDDDESDGYKVFLGRQLSERWGLELSYADIGEAGLGNVDPIVNASANPEIDYKVSALMLSYAFYKPNENWDIYGKFGVSNIRNSVNTDLVRYERQHSVQVAMGLGALYRFNQNWFMRAEIDSYDTDANFASLQVGRYFGGTNVAAKHEPIDVEQLKKDKEIAEEHQQPKKEKFFEPLHEKVYFGVDEFTLTAKAQKTLDNVIIFMSKLDKPFVVDIEGHADSTYTEPYNESLSAKRVQAVKDYLVAAGVSASDIQSSYLGERAPAASNDSEEGRALNRRVEIWVKREPL